MLTVFHGGEGHIISNDDYYIRQLASGLDEVVFNVSIRDPIYQYINEEAVIKDRDQNIYIIKQIDAGENTAKVIAQINIDDWRSAMYMDYTNNSATVANTVAGILPNGWTIRDEALKTIRRTIPTSDTTRDYNVTAWEILEDCCDVYSVRFRFDTKNKIIHIIDPDSYTSRGAFATRDLNLRKLDYKGKSDNFITRLYAMGADGLTFASINDGKAYVDNQSYAPKVISYFWKDERYTVKEDLLADARKKLAEMAQPTRSYDCDVLDLANTNPEMYGFEDFSLFEVVTLIDDAKEVRTDYQVVEHWIYPYYPARNKVVLSTSTPNIQKLVTNIVDSIESSTSPFQQILQSAIENSTAIITGNHGGYVVFHDSDGDGTPDEILIMNTPDIATATKVWRWNSAGLGYSGNGYNGPYGLAMTIDGSIVANYITAGELNAAILKVGTITDKLGKNYWNLNTGAFSLSSAATIGGKTASQISAEVLNDWVNETYTPDTQALITKIDGKAETWYQALDPSAAWVTTADKGAHVGDLWYNTTNQTTWYYEYDSVSDTYQWREQNVPQEVFDQIDGKARAFLTQPVPPYDIGDIWFEGTSGNILSCVTAKADGDSFSAADWQKKNFYIDQSAVNNSISAYDATLNQSEIFNKLTDNGTIQGIFMQDGQLYINGAYIQANTISANALSVDARESLVEKHSYVNDPFDDISIWHNDGGNVPISYETIDGVKYLVFDFTNISAGTTNWSDVVYTPINLAGNTSINVHFKYHIDRAITITTSQRLPAIKFKKNNDSSYWYVSRTLSPQDIPANTDFTWNTTLTPTDVDATQQAYFGFYPIAGCKMYFSELTITSTLNDYATAGITFNANGLSSTVQKDGVISAINQSAEQVSINASKIDLSGDLTLTGAFTAKSSRYVNTNAALKDGALYIYDYTTPLGKLERATDVDGTTTISLTCYDSAGNQKNIYSGYSASIKRATFDHINVNGFEATSVFYREVEFKGNVYNSSGGVQFVSDKRKKRSIKDLVVEKARSFIMALKPREYKFIKDISQSNRKHHGFIAQEVKEAMHEDWGLYCENEKEDFIGLRYDEFIADMVAVIQDQEKRIEALERRVNDLTNNQSRPNT